MKLQKRLFGFLLAGVICCSSVSAFAAEIENQTPVSITSGLDLEREDTESTFDSSRTISGEAQPDTTITVSVSRKNADGDMVVSDEQEVRVGSMGIFAATIALEMGYNYVTLTAEQDGYDTVSDTASIKRLPQQLKKELQTMIALPGVY